MLKLYILICGLVFVLTIYSCKETPKPVAEDAKKEELAKDIYSVEVNLPDGPGANVFKQKCIICHSARYVEMQPPLPRKAWQKVVDKMVKNFGAPIDSVSAVAIVDYLMVVRGKE